MLRAAPYAAAARRAGRGALRCLLSVSPVTHSLTSRIRTAAGPPLASRERREPPDCLRRAGARSSRPLRKPSPRLTAPCPRPFQPHPLMYNPHAYQAWYDPSVRCALLFSARLPRRRRASPAHLLAALRHPQIPPGAVLHSLARSAPGRISDHYARRYYRTTAAEWEAARA